MPNVNLAIVAGHVGRDPEVRALPDGTSVVNFSVATSESWKDKAGKHQELTEWHNISVFGKLADVTGKYLKKGSSVMIEGTLRTRKWKDKSGQERYTTEIKANKVHFMMPREKSAPTEKVQQNDAVELSDIDDDIPF